MQEIYGKMREFVHEHWIKAMMWLIATFISSLWTWVWARRKWRSRHDLDIIHFAQNTFETRNDAGGKKWLILDVLREGPLKSVIAHPVPRKLIKDAAKLTTETQPFLIFDAADRFYVLNLVLVEIAEMFKTGTGKKLFDPALVVTVDCVFALTYERYPKMRQGKLRVMVVKRSDLDCLPAIGDLSFESPTHCDRMRTLAMMREDCAAGMDQAKHCMAVRLNIVR